MTLPDKEDPNCRRPTPPAVEAVTDRVGYKNPPKHSRFKGSGNPGGRPKKPQRFDFDNVVVDLLEGKIPHSDKTWLELLVSSLAKQSARGDIRATKYLCDLYLDAKRRKRHGSSDLEADQQAAERLLASLAPIATTTDGATEEPASDKEAPSDTADE